MRALRLAAIALARPRPPRGAPTPEEMDRLESLLVVRAHDQLGDFLLATPALAALRARFPRARLDLVVNRFLAPLAEGQPDVDRVLVAPWGRGSRSLAELARFRSELRRERYDLALVLNTVSHSLSSDLVARAARVTRVAGPRRPELKDTSGAPLYDWAYETPPPASPHQIDRALAAVAPLGCPPVPRSYRFALRDDEREAAAALRRSLPAGTLFALHVGTKDPAKRYPAAQWIEAANAAANACGARIALLYAPDAFEETERIARGLNPAAVRLPAMGLRAVAALLEHVDLLLCHDSALLHVAAAVGTPTVSVHGRGAVAEWKPPHERHVALQAEDHVPAHVPPAAVADACAQALRLAANPA